MDAFIAMQQAGTDASDVWRAQHQGCAQMSEQFLQALRGPVHELCAIVQRDAKKSGSRPLSAAILQLFFLVSTSTTFTLTAIDFGAATEVALRHVQHDKMASNFLRALAATVRAEVLRSLQRLPEACKVQQVALQLVLDVPATEQARRAVAFVQPINGASTWCTVSVAAWLGLARVFCEAGISGEGSLLKETPEEKNSLWDRLHQAAASGELSPAIVERFQLLKVVPGTECSRCSAKVTAASLRKCTRCKVCAQLTATSTSGHAVIIAEWQRDPCDVGNEDTRAPLWRQSAPQVCATPCCSMSPSHCVSVKRLFTLKQPRSVQAAYYCSQECQRADWRSRHKRACRSREMLQIGDIVSVDINNIDVSSAEPDHWLPSMLLANDASTGPGWWRTRYLWTGPTDENPVQSIHEQHMTLDGRFVHASDASRDAWLHEMSVDESTGARLI